MNATEVTALLAICSSYDSRKPNPETVQAWTAAIGDLNFTAARDAVVAHYQESREWIMPADIRGRVRRERRERIEDDVIPMPAGLDPDDTAAYIRVLRAGRTALAQGEPLSEPAGMTRRDLRELIPEDACELGMAGQPIDHDRRAAARAAARAGRETYQASTPPEPKRFPPTVMHGPERGVEM